MVVIQFIVIGKRVRIFLGALGSDGISWAAVVLKEGRAKFAREAM